MAKATAPARNNNTKSPNLLIRKEPSYLSLLSWVMAAMESEVGNQARIAET